MIKIILSAELSTLTAHANSNRTTDLDGILRGLTLTGKLAGHRRVTGCYRGTREASFLCELDEQRNRGSGLILAGLAEFFGQESILYVNGAGEASLIYTEGGRVEKLGYWQAFDPMQVGDEPEAYTLDGGTFWMACDPLPAQPVSIPFDAAWAEQQCAILGYN